MKHILLVFSYILVLLLVAINGFKISINNNRRTSKQLHISKINIKNRNVISFATMSSPSSSQDTSLQNSDLETIDL